MREDSEHISSKNVEINKCLEEIKDPAKEKILATLNQSDAIVAKVWRFGEVLDDFGIDPIVSLLPGIWDAGISTFSTLFLLHQGRKLWLSWKDLSKIFGLQILDTLVWSIPVVGDIGDFFFKANKKSAKIFNKHSEKIKQRALELGISQSEIDKFTTNASTVSKGIKETTSSEKPIKMNRKDMRIIFGTEFLTAA